MRREHRFSNDLDKKLFTAEDDQQVTNEGGANSCGVWLGLICEPARICVFG